MNKIIIDVPTNNIEIIPLTLTELTELEELRKQEKEKHLLLEETETQTAINKAAAQAKLAALGLTADDLKALGL